MTQITKDLNKLEEMVLEGKPKERFKLVESVITKKGYKKIGDKTYTKLDDYFFQTGSNLYYLDKATKNEYQEIKSGLEFQQKINSSWRMLGDASIVGSSAFGGAGVGYLLMTAGINPMIMIPCIIIPPALSLYNIVRKSMKNSNKDREIREMLEGYSNKLYKGESAIHEAVHRNWTVP